MKTITIALSAAIFTLTVVFSYLLCHTGMELTPGGYLDMLVIIAVVIFIYLIGYATSLAHSHDGPNATESHAG